MHAETIQEQSSAVAEMAAQCCTTGIVKRWSGLFFWGKNWKRSVRKVVNHIKSKLESFGYIFVADMDPVSVNLTLVPKTIALGKMTQNNGHYTRFIVI